MQMTAMPMIHWSSLRYSLKDNSDYRGIPSALMKSLNDTSFTQQQWKLSIVLCQV